MELAQKICRQTKCSGCTDLSLALDKELELKEQSLMALIQSLGLKTSPQVFRSPLSYNVGLRDRLDFRFENGKLGLLSRDKTELVDLDQCPQLSDKLQEWLTLFRSFEIPINTRGSLRLRVSPQGDFGVWYDFPNQAVAFLFEEQTYLKKILSVAEVEVGQRRKALVLKEGQLSLSKIPKLLPWSKTWVGNTPVPLYHRIADFSQVGEKSNQAILNALQETLSIWPTPELQTQNWVEFGSGAGNLSFALANRVKSLTAYEVDEFLVQGFHKSLSELTLNFQGLKERCQTQCLDAQRGKINLSNFDGILVNPPRSGVGRFFSELKGSNVRQILYLSCYPESWIKDMGPLIPEWRCTDITLINQFPHTPHLEVLSRWTRE